MFKIENGWFIILMLCAFIFGWVTTDKARERSVKSIYEVKSSIDEVNIERIIIIESSGNPYALNERSGARGLMQITPICLKEWNNENLDKYTLDDLYNPVINKRIGTWYMNEKIPTYLWAYNIKDTIENRLIAYNWGIGNLRNYVNGKLKNLPYETKRYIKKYREV